MTCRTNPTKQPKYQIGPSKMYKSKSVCVVVPCFNEGSQIGLVVRTMPSIVDKIIIVDDKSTDETVQIALKLKDEDSRIVVIEHTENQGVGGAIASGYKYARDEDFDMAVVMAGDGQMDPENLTTLLDPVADGDCDYSKGNRFLWKNAYKMVPKTRFMGNTILSFLTKVASGYWHVSDSQTGYTVANKEVLREIDWDGMYKRYGQPNDLLIKLNIGNFRVRDVAIKPVYGVGEQSKMKVGRVIFTITNIILRGFLNRMFTKYVFRDFHPLVLFYGLSFASFLIAIILSFRITFVWISTGQVPELTLMAFLFSLSTALQTLFFGMWFDMESNKHLR